MTSPLSWFARPFSSFLPGTSVRNARPDPSRHLRDRRELVVSMVEKQLQSGADPEIILQALTPRAPIDEPAERA